MTIEGIDSVLLVESAQWSMFRAVRDRGGEPESMVRIDNLLDRRLNLMKYGPPYFQSIGQFI